ncbi:Leucine dehydrogenase [Linnemannia zychae]|nr:Leucine dehydrogenase [Linnemannia zychae]
MRYGKPLAALPTIKQKLGQMQSQLMTIRLTVYHAVHLLDEDIPYDADLISTKLVNVESSLDAVRTAMEIYAAYGLYPDHHVERFFHDANHIYALAGTLDIQHLRLAEVALDTYKDQWSARFLEQLHITASSDSNQSIAISYAKA